jgi:hypothetical protein
MAPRIRKAKPSVFQLHIALLELEGAPVWRRVLVPSDIRLGELHLVLNEAMGWTHSHLHQFVVGKRTFGDPDTDEDGVFEDEGGVRLDELVGVKDRFIYEYDFGDDWMHEVRVEKKVAFDERVLYPVCIGGARACPPEDCGGPLGYERLLEALENDDDDELVSWVGGFFDPAGFDVNRTNQALRNGP